VLIEMKGSGTGSSAGSGSGSRKSAGSVIVNPGCGRGQTLLNALKAPSLSSKRGIV
jgi:hypothetical protein